MTNEEKAREIDAGTIECKQQQSRFLLYKNNGELEYLSIADCNTITSTGDGLCVMKEDGSCKFCDMITVEDNQIDIKGLCDDFLDRYEPKSK